MKGYLLILTVTLLAACSRSTHIPIPVVTSYAATGQQKMQAAHHWNVLAYDVAKRLKRSVDLTFSKASKKPPLIINITDKQQKDPFAKAFSSLLTTKLVQQGVVVLTGDTKYAGETLGIDYDVQVIHHKREGLLAIARNRKTNTEVIITTSIIRNQQYIFNDSRIYYINNGDNDHYYHHDYAAKTYQVVNQ